MWQRISKEIRTMPWGVWVLVGLMVFGLSVALYRPYAGLAVTTNLSDAYPWGLWIGFDLFVVAFSGGAFTLAAIVYIFQMHEFHPAVRPTVLTGLAGYASVLVILVMDLGRWDRFYHFAIFPNINSALFEVSWCILLYSLVLISEFSPVVCQKFGWERLGCLMKKITLPLVIVGVTLSTLHQSSLGSLFVVMSERLHPLLYTPFIPVMFFVSSVAAGLAMVTGGATVSRWVFKRTLPRNVVAELGWFLPWVLGFYLIMKTGELLAAGDLGLLAANDFYSTLFLTELAIGVVAPLILFSFAAIRRNRNWALFGAILVLLGVFINRFAVTWWALKPIDGCFYSPSWQEIAIQVGVLSGAVLVYTLVGRYLPLFEGTVDVERAARIAQGDPAPQPAGD
jgi:Ni/Fe-hydrogenase subunit HybB-like protein